MRYKEGDKVFIQELNQKSWKGPVEVLNQRARDVYVFSNGGLKKIADSRVQPYNVSNFEDDQVEGDNGVYEKFQDSVDMKCPHLLDGC